ncbi:MAG: glycine cleavage system aminomethyltransferase GcvT [Ornithinimicrobium sp.]|uniref:glycine cleavage system aminomethyltransferase GcvT n=1 Tax=Ornithinimicrobium sp. TaxID=1977084 RepID=UPI0026E03F0C|nr:glycine cleavage system aminomethyltransferase GcvT [Ornithinimicrobium sp.]MDO5741072.1 glycine cleavage system aminomethyltransferase GcvT [Ornithinimicrobium sp.]
MSEQTKKSPLHDKHEALGAKMADFGGWSMPIEYAGGGVVAEHTAVRERVGLFDVSHLGNALITGAGAKDFLNACFTNDLERIHPGKAQYTLCCDENGGVVDDLIVYLRSDEDLLLIPNAANTTEVIRRLQEVAPEGISVTNVHEDYAILAIQGPKSDEVLEALGLPTGHEYMSFVDAQWRGHELTVCRTGYTGERGYELVCGVEDASALWDAVVSAMEPFDGRACGLGARDTLRTEMGYPLHGHELSLDITPVMAKTGWAVGWKKEAFWGKEALSAQREAKESRVTNGLLVTGRGIPRADCAVLDADGNTVGEVTSGTFSPTLKQGIALALMDRSVAQGDEVSIDVRGRQVAATVTKPPFVERGAGA